MNKKLNTTRPALAAIAAVIVLSTTPLMAQEQPAVDQTPAPAQQTLPETPAAVSQTPAVAAATPSAEALPVPVFVLDVPVTQTLSEKLNVAEIIKAPKPVAKKVVATASVIAAIGKAPIASNTVDTSAIITPVSADTASPSPAQTSSPLAVSQNSGPDANWSLIGTIAAAFGLAGLGGAYANRRRKLAIVDPTRPKPVNADTAKVRTGQMLAERFAASPFVIPHAETGVIETRPTNYSVKREPRTAQANGYYTARVNDAPSAENPFLTLKKRIRRAKFLDRQAVVDMSTRMDQQSNALWQQNELHARPQVNTPLREFEPV